MYNTQKNLSIVLISDFEQEFEHALVLTSVDSHSKHFWSTAGSGVWQYLHTGQLKKNVPLINK